MPGASEQKSTQDLIRKSINCILRNGIERYGPAGFEFRKADDRNRAGTNFREHLKQRNCLNCNRSRTICETESGTRFPDFPKSPFRQTVSRTTLTEGESRTSNRPLHALCQSGQLFGNALRRSRTTAPNRSFRRTGRSIPQMRNRPTSRKRDIRQVTFPGSLRASNRARPNTAAAPSSNSRAPG
jgi:hypothetical protein